MAKRLVENSDDSDNTPTKLSQKSKLKQSTDLSLEIVNDMEFVPKEKQSPLVRSNSQKSNREIFDKQKALANSQVNQKNLGVQ